MIYFKRGLLNILHSRAHYSLLSIRPKYYESSKTEYSDSPKKFKLFLLQSFVKILDWNYRPLLLPSNSNLMKKWSAGVFAPPWIGLIFNGARIMTSISLKQTAIGPLGEVCENQRVNINIKSSMNKTHLSLISLYK